MDPFNLQRFIDAQASTYDQAVRELQSGRKRSHWMWYVFPQFAGLGGSAMAVRYAIASLSEACAYAAHGTLGPRLELCTQTVNRLEDHSIDQIFGYPDHLKFHSSMTLFAHATQRDVFREAIDKYFAAKPDTQTLALVGP